RHALDKEQIIDKEGKLLKIAGEFGGMLIDQARPAIVQKLKAKGLLVSVDEGYSHNVAINSRGGAMIEPQILEQWFIKVAPLAKKALAAVRSGEIKIIPANFEKIYFHWMENIHDWNISRQIWWGHSIPVFTCAACRHEFVSVEVADTCPKCQSAVTQDPDTLDTWFSSGLWTFATLGWPDKTPDLERWHPTTLMETGRDIIFFWVARMIMFSLYFMDEVPFKTVYLHGLVLDKDGKKMSKSKGNGIEPLEMADKYGTDALRLSLNTGVSAGLDTRLGEDKIAHQRNFVNKLWNVSRFVIKTTKCERTCERLSQIKLDDLELEDQWILDRLGLLTEATTRALEEYRFSDAIVGLQDFVWNDFADWYLEIAKRKPGPAKNDVLLGVLEHVLALLHPVAPFVTEVIWQELKKSDPEAARRPDLIVSAWPATNKQLHNAKSRKDFEELQTLVKTLRAIRADYHITFATKLAISVSPSKSLQLQAPLVEQLTNTTITFGKTGQGLKRTAGSGVVHADLQGLVDVKSEKERLAKELAKLTGVYAALTKRLASKTFIDKAPAAIVAKERERERELSKKIQELERLVQELGQIR
ncbi:MAG: class I tRNA ligase family protein, partial [bacterium]|nr:class I tRNA ligase family protein [bacterium]